MTSPRLSKLLVCTVLLFWSCSRSNEKNEELAQARAELEVARAEAVKARAEAEAAKAAMRQLRPQARVCFAIHSYDGVIQTLGIGPLKE
jgi:hypothetical protein